MTRREHDQRQLFLFKMLRNWSATLELISLILMKSNWYDGETIFEYEIRNRSLKIDFIPIIIKKICTRDLDQITIRMKKKKK